MRSGPLLSVCFPTYRRAVDVARTLELLRSTLKIPYETIIVDNSPEPSDYGLLSNERCLLSGSNLGALARNIGDREAKAPYVLQLDDDSHPLPGAIELALAKLESCGPEVAGVTSQVVKLDGSLENTPLLPTVFHGCGVLLRKSALDAVGDLYPKDFLFYGEEYWSTLLLHSRGFRFEHLDAFRVCHRFSGSGRSKEQILYRLIVNNRRTWAPFVPAGMEDFILSQTARRYELVAEKEGVSAFCAKAFTEPLAPPDPSLKRLSKESFASYSLLDKFEALPGRGLKLGEKALLCGLGKFPLLWAEALERFGVAEVLMTDLNPGLAGKDYCGRRTLQLDDALKLAKEGCQSIYGHCSVGDSRRWSELLAESGAARVFDVQAC